MSHNTKKSSAGGLEVLLSLLAGGAGGYYIGVKQILKELSDALNPFTERL